MTTEATSANEGTAAEATTEGVAAQGAASEAVVAGAETGAPAGEGQAEAGVAVGAGVGQRPEGIPDEFWDDATGLKTGDLAAAYREMKAKADEATADVPGETENYELKVSEAVQLPENYALDIDAESPFFKEVSAAAKEAGLPRPVFQKLLDAEARRQIAEQEASVETYVAEMTKLGANAKPRVGAAESWLKANLPADEAYALDGIFLSAAGVKALERIISLKSGPVAATGVKSVPAAPSDRAERWYAT